jgi:hypothetical protein
MNEYLIAGIVYGILSIFGFILSITVSTIKCSKQSFSTSTMEGLVWALPSALIMLATGLSPYFLSIFSEPMKFFDSAMPQETADTIGRGFAMMLAIFAMSTRMIHTTEIAVCKPSKDELKKFQADLQKELKEKEEKAKQ